MGQLLGFCQQHSENVKQTSTVSVMFGFDVHLLKDLMICRLVFMNFIIVVLHC